MSQDVKLNKIIEKRASTPGLLAGLLAVLLFVACEKSPTLPGTFYDETPLTYF
jgi:hypothetical protein